MVFKKVECFNNLSFSGKSAQMLCIGNRGGGGGVTGHFRDYFTSSLNLRHSCTSPVLCWSLGSISIAIAWKKKVLGCHKFCFVDSVDRLTFHRPKPHLSCQKCPKTVFSSKEDVPMYTLWKNESIPTRIAWDMAERVPRLLRAIGPPLNRHRNKSGLQYSPFTVHA